MIDTRLDELVQLKIDGEMSSEEVDELRLLLERDPEAKQYLEEMGSMGDALDGLGEVSPPSDLLDQISAAVKSEASGARISTRSTPNRQSAWSGGRVVRVGLGLAAAVVVAILLTPIVVNRVDTDQLGGTMTRVEETAPTLLTPTTLSIPVTANGVNGSIVLESTSDRVTVDLQIATSGTADAVVRFDSSVIELETVDGVFDSPVVRMEQPGTVVVPLSATGVRLGFVRRTPEEGLLRVELRPETGESVATRLNYSSGTNF